MQPELTKSLLESVEFANDRLADCAAVAKESHCNADDVWDSEEIQAEHRACLAHTYRLARLGMAGHGKAGQGATR